MLLAVLEIAARTAPPQRGQAEAGVARAGAAEAELAQRAAVVVADSPVAELTALECMVGRAARAIRVCPAGQARTMEAAGVMAAAARAEARQAHLLLIAAEEEGVDIAAAAEGASILGAEAEDRSITVQVRATPPAARPPATAQ